MANFDGQVQRDNYDSYVLGMFNTLDRLADEYSTEVKQIIDNKLGYSNNTNWVMYDKDEYGNKNSILALFQLLKGILIKKV
jgi:hypothetical protein